MSAHAVRTACGLAALPIAASRAAAGGLDFPIAEDTHVDSRISNGAENWNFGADHTDKVVVNGQDSPISLCRALFRLPADLWLYAPSQIISAKVMFYVWQDNSGDRGVSLFPLTTDFVQGSGSKYGQPDPVDGATWWTCDGSNAWTTPGGDFDANFPISGVKEDILDESAHDRFFHWDVTGLLTNAAARTNLQAHGALLMIDEEPAPAPGTQYWAAFTSSHDPAYQPPYLPRLQLVLHPSIPRPNFGVPAFVQPGATFQAEVEADADLTNVAWAAALANDLRAWTGAVEQVAFGRCIDNDTAVGYRLTIRQLYYQLVARGHIENTVRSYDNIVALALEHGFKLKPQVDGRMAINDYVIGFARAVYDIGRADAVDAARAEALMAMGPCHGSAEHPLHTADQLAAAVAAERKKCAQVCDRLSVKIED